MMSAKLKVQQWEIDNYKQQLIHLELSRTGKFQGYLIAD
jgi:hypothetical protein